MFSPREPSRTEERLRHQNQRLKAIIKVQSAQGNDNCHWLKGNIPQERPPGPTNSEIQQLLSNVDKICRESNISFLTTIGITDEIRKTFIIPNKNLPFVKGLYDRSKIGGWLFKQNTPCEICGENRSADSCHIIPREFGGAAAPNNILYLCPTHHRLFDRHMLFKEEWGKIIWSNKGVAASKYARIVLLPAFKSFWGRVEGTNFQRETSSAVSRALTAQTRQHDFVVDELRNILKFSPGLTFDEIANLVSIDKKSCARIIKELIKQSVVSPTIQYGKRCYRLRRA
ncbi:MAG: HNH endonuclease signature motif containing protein [Planctomycetota bacterium]